MKIINNFIYFLFFFPILIFLPNITSNPCQIQGVIFYFLITLIFSYYIINGIIKKKIRLPVLSSLEISVIIFWFICFVTWLIALIRFPEYRLPIYWMGKEKLMLLTFNGLLCFFVPIFFIKDETSLNKIFNIIFLSLTIASLYAILQFFGIEFIWNSKNIPYKIRPISTFGNPNFLASYIILVLPILISKTINKKNKSIYIGMILIFLTALITTLTRSAWLGFVIGMLVFTILYLKEKRVTAKGLKIFLLIFIILSGLIFLTPAKKVLNNRLKETVNIEKNTALADRVAIWKIAKDNFFKYPVIGVGFGSFEIFHSMQQGKYLEVGIAKRFHYLRHLHNLIMELLTQVGILGFGIFIWLLICLFKVIFKILKNKDIKESSRIEQVAILSSVVAILVDNMFNVTLFYASPMMLFWFLLGVTVSRSNWIQGKELKEHKVSVIEKLILIGIIHVLVFLSIKELKSFIAERYYFKGAAISRTQKDLKILQRAIPYHEKSYKYDKHKFKNLFWLANTYAKLKLWDKAIKTYNQALKVHPAHYEAQVNLSRIYRIKNNPNQSLKYLERAKKINPLLKITK